MAEKHKIGPDGILNDGVPLYPAGNSDLDMFQITPQHLAHFPLPILFHSGNPHDRLYVATLDGTGNDVFSDPEHETNVAWIYRQIEAHERIDPRIFVGYVGGAGTQDGFFRRALDGARGYTCEERTELMYKKFIDQAWKWKREDPEAHISLAATGFSRGADEVAILTRLVHERGIQDPTGAHYTYTSDGLVKHAEYTRPPLVPPGQTAQAVALFDAVGTGNEIRNDDRRLPPTAISGFQVIAMDEKRSLFKSDHIIDPGISADGRFAGVYVPGAHSDVGGGYHRDGLSIRAGNLVIDYLNGLSDEPFLTKRIEPDDPRLNVVHRSEEGMFIYRITGKVNRLKPEGYNELLVPRREIDKVTDPYNAEPVDKALRARFKLQPFHSSPTPDNVAPGRHATKHVLSSQVDHMLAAARSGDWQTFSRDTQALAAMDAGRDLQAQASATVNALEQSAMRQPVQPVSMPNIEVRGPVR